MSVQMEYFTPKKNQPQQHEKFLKSGQIYINLTERCVLSSGTNYSTVNLNLY